MPDCCKCSSIEARAEPFRQLIEEASASYHGEHYEFRDVAMMPKPQQDPFPLYVGGHNMGALERAARFARG